MSYMRVLQCNSTIGDIALKIKITEFQLLKPVHGVWLEAKDGYKSDLFFLTITILFEVRGEIRSVSHTGLCDCVLGNVIIITFGVFFGNEVSEIKANENDDMKREWREMKNSE